MFWARRQCHETTIHGVDALAASLGRLPEPHEADWIDPEVALDGIDELLTGFVTRGKTGFADVGSTAFEVRPEEGGRAWRLEVQPDGAVATTRLGAEVSDGTTLRGSAVALYLALWNRAAPAGEDPNAVLSDVWQERVRVRWG